MSEHPGIAGSTVGTPTVRTDGGNDQLADVAEPMCGWHDKEADSKGRASYLHGGSAAVHDKRQALIEDAENYTRRKPFDWEAPWTPELPTSGQGLPVPALPGPVAMVAEVTVNVFAIIADLALAIGILKGASRDTTALEEKLAEHVVAASRSG